MRFKISLEYEGTKYSGWQLQKEQKTIQGELLAAAQTIFKTEKLEFYGAGRTDAGVHAICQVAHLEVQTSLIPDHIRQKMNEALPSDINILKIEKVNPEFHARHDATARSYIYQISRRRSAFGKKFSWWVKDKLDVKQMQAAAKLFVGLKDFQSFSDDTPEEKSTQVELMFIDIYEEGSLIIFHIVGSHFLWKMVRRIVGVLTEVGKGNMTLEQVKEFFAKYSNEPAKLTMPPTGLFLERVYYGTEKIKHDFQRFLRM